MTTTFVMVPAHEYEAMRDDLARIRQLLEARQPEPSRHITLAKWAREAGLEIEAARRSGLNARTVTNLLRDGKLPGHKAGGSWMVRWWEVNPMSYGQ